MPLLALIHRARGAVRLLGYCETGSVRAGLVVADESVEFYDRRPEDLFCLGEAFFNPQHVTCSTACTLLFLRSANNRHASAVGTTTNSILRRAAS